MVKKESNYKTIKRLFFHFKDFKFKIILGIILLGLSSLSGLAYPYITGHILDNILLKSKSYKEFFFFVLLILILQFMSYIFSFKAKNNFSEVSVEVSNNVKVRLLDKIITLPMSYLNKKEKGYIQQKIDECNKFGQIASPMYMGMVYMVFDFIFASIIMIMLNWKFALIIFFIVPIYYYEGKKISSELDESHEKAFELRGMVRGETFEVLNGIEDVKVLNGRSRQVKKYKDKLSSLGKSELKLNKALISLFENMVLLDYIGSIMGLIIGGIFIIKGDLTIGEYTAVNIYISRVLGYAQQFSNLGTSIKEIKIGVEKVYELLDLEGEDSTEVKEFTEKINDIKINDLSFSYDDDGKQVINSLDFQINKGDTLLVKGENGSGKSTLVKLLLGLYKANDGNIYYNDKNISLLDKGSIRKKFGIVSQRIFLFRGTVLDNILYGHINKNRDDVIKIIEKCDLGDYIDRMPNGLDTIINQNDSGVSGGQSQIIAFIRAILEKKDVLVLDEPISNVDIETSEKIINLIREKDLAHIIIIISHQQENLGFISKVINL